MFVFSFGKCCWIMSFSGVASSSSCDTNEKGFASMENLLISRLARTFGSTLFTETFGE